MVRGSLTTFMHGALQMKHGTKLTALDHHHQHETHMKQLHTKIACLFLVDQLETQKVIFMNTV